MISRSIADQSRTIRIPVHLVETMNKIKKVERSAGPDGSGANRPSRRSRPPVELPVERSRSSAGSAVDPTSLDAPVGEDGDGSMGELIEDANATVPVEAASLPAAAQHLADVLDELNPASAPSSSAASGCTTPSRTPSSRSARARADPRADPPDRGQGARQAAPPGLRRRARGLPERSVVAAPAGSRRSVGRPVGRGWAGPGPERRHPTGALSVSHPCSSLGAWTSRATHHRHRTRRAAHPRRARTGSCDRQPATATRPCRRRCPSGPTSRSRSR
jgi:hypothetical protein